MAKRSQFSNIDEYGFERADDFDYETYEDFMSSYLRVLAKRSKKWTELMARKSAVRRSLTTKRYIRKGIPKEHRGLVWMAVSGAEKARQAQPNLYLERLRSASDVHEDILSCIRTDLPRTFPDNVHYKATALAYSQTGQLQLQDRTQPRQLYNVLVAFASDNHDIGYCQGMNYIAGLLLIATGEEETAFWLLKTLIDRSLPGYYNKRMTGIIRDIDVLGELVRLKFPEVHRHVESLNLSWAVITTKWFVCLFAEVLPVETVFRVWDCLFYEGAKILFRVALTLVGMHIDALLRCEDLAALITCFKAVTQDALVTDCHAFLQSIFKVPGSLKNTTISRLRSECAERNKKPQK
ncbi:growth hormone-regulated TBC protein 1-A [Neocloeon triangulifer]|uniref:growth hormone-regulated TBC protein 1-A n=1 Tax=Neocloeon triangulifer TaxID=2078957 RepID=UPI00286F6B28|nr:growth hormone-regulated TBC protein 1-A [Neocloeon triangulifer]